MPPGGRDETGKISINEARSEGVKRIVGITAVSWPIQDYTLLSDVQTVVKQPGLKARRRFYSADI